MKFQYKVRPYDEAKANGDKIYIGKECKRGHGGIRYVLDRACMSCQAMKSSKKTAKQIGVTNFSAHDDIQEAKRLKADLSDPWDEITG